MGRSLELHVSAVLYNAREAGCFATLLVSPVAGGLVGWWVWVGRCGWVSSPHQPGREVGEAGGGWVVGILLANQDTELTQNLTAGGGKRRVAIPGVLVAGHPVQKGMDAKLVSGECGVSRQNVLVKLW